MMESTGWQPKIWKIYREGGLHHLSRRALRKLMRSIFESNDAYWLYLHSSKINPPALVCGLERFSMKYGQSDTTIEYIRKEGFYHPAELEVGLANGHIYSSLAVDDEIIGYNKLGLSRVYIYDFRCSFDLPPDVAFTYDTMIDPRFRGRGFGAFLLYKAIREAEKRGVKKIWAHIPPANVPSLVMHSKLGFRVVEHIKYYRFAGLRHYSYPPQLLFNR